MRNDGTPDRESTREESPLYWKTKDEYERLQNLNDPAYQLKARRDSFKENMKKLEAKNMPAGLVQIFMQMIKSDSLPISVDNMKRIISEDKFKQGYSPKQWGTEVIGLQTKTKAWLNTASSAWLWSLLVGFVPVGGIASLVGAIGAELTAEAGIRHFVSSFADRLRTLLTKDKKGYFYDFFTAIYPALTSSDVTDYMSLKTYMNKNGGRSFLATPKEFNFHSDRFESISLGSNLAKALSVKKEDRRGRKGMYIVNYDIKDIKTAARIIDQAIEDKKIYLLNNNFATKSGDLESYDKRISITAHLEYILRIPDDFTRNTKVSRSVYKNFNPKDIKSMLDKVESALKTQEPSPEEEAKDLKDVKTETDRFMSELFNEGKIKMKLIKLNLNEFNNLLNEQAALADDALKIVVKTFREIDDLFTAKKAAGTLSKLANAIHLGERGIRFGVRANSKLVSGLEKLFTRVNNADELGDALAAAVEAASYEAKASGKVVVIYRDVDIISTAKKTAGRISKKSMAIAVDQHGIIEITVNNSSDVALRVIQKRNSVTTSAANATPTVGDSAVAGSSAERARAAADADRVKDRAADADRVKDRAADTGDSAADVARAAAAAPPVTRHIPGLESIYFPKKARIYTSYDDAYAAAKAQNPKKDAFRKPISDGGAHDADALIGYEIRSADGTTVIDTQYMITKADSIDIDIVDLETLRDVVAKYEGKFSFHTNQMHAAVANIDPKAGPVGKFWDELQRNFAHELKINLKFRGNRIVPDTAFWTASSTLIKLTFASPALIWVPLIRTLSFALKRWEGYSLAALVAGEITMYFIYSAAALKLTTEVLSGIENVGTEYDTVVALKNGPGGYLAAAEYIAKNLMTGNNVWLQGKEEEFVEDALGVMRSLKKIKAKYKPGDLQKTIDGILAANDFARLPQSYAWSLIPWGDIRSTEQKENAEVKHELKKSTTAAAERKSRAKPAAPGAPAGSDTITLRLKQMWSGTQGININTALNGKNLEKNRDRTSLHSKSTVEETYGNHIAKIEDYLKSIPSGTYSEDTNYQELAKLVATVKEEIGGKIKRESFHNKSAKLIKVNINNILN